MNRPTHFPTHREDGAGSGAGSCGSWHSLIAGVYRLLLCDRFGSHLTYEFVKFCEDHRIILFFLPPHSSHILQPLDVGVFSVYKHYHSQAVEDATITGCDKFNKDEFLAAIQQIRAKTFRLSTIKLGFQLTGLWPINPDLILDDLVSYGYQDQYEERESTPSLSTVSTTISTPKTAERVKRLEERINQLDPSTASIRLYATKLAKAARTMAYLSEQLSNDLEATNYASSIRHARQNKSRQYSKITGIISSDQVMKMKRIEQKGTDLQAIDRLRPRWKKVMQELKRHCRATGRRIR